MEEKIVGYDAREMWCKDVFDFDFRMGSRLVKMLSASDELWLSIFNYPSGSELIRKARVKCAYPTIDLPPMSLVGINYPLWSNLASLQNCLRPYCSAGGKPYWVVAITVRTRDLEQESRDKDHYPWPYEPESHPDSIQSDWALVGYDVTSEYSASMISAHFFAEAEAEHLSELAGELNEYLLFPSSEKAGEFKIRWDMECPSESPHIVYGIWRIEEIRCTTKTAREGSGVTSCISNY